jgi:hypothetical protein
MAKLTAVQTAPNCRWVRLDYRFLGIRLPAETISPWRCVRPYQTPRNVTDEECAACEFFEAEENAEN